MGRGSTTDTVAAPSRAEQRHKDAEDKLVTYRREIRKVPNGILIDKAAGAILDAAILDSRGRDDGGYADGCAMACLEEATRRGNRDLYKRAFNRARRSQGHEELEQISTPVEVGEPAMAISGLGDGAFHLLAEDDRKLVLCGKDADIPDPLHLRRDEINTGFVCSSCLAVEETRFAELREENGLSEAYELAVG